MNISAARLAANRANATLSTGPRTEAGKAKVALNAVKTGLTGCTVLLPSEDAEPYRTHVAAYQNEFQPVGPQECDLVQSIADIRWRLNRIPGLELAIYARGRIEFAGLFNDRPEQERAPLMELETFLAYENQLRNLHLQEARLARRRERELAELRALQEQRKVMAAGQPKDTTAPAKLIVPENGFEFPNPPSVALSPADQAIEDLEIFLETAA
jgi:hypothetical protein